MERLVQESQRLFGIEISAPQLAALQQYAALLVDWNSRLNLTAIRDPEQIRVKHFLDSLSCLCLRPEPSGRVVDVGTGAGFPGLVLKIMRPQIRLTLVESVAKKAEFCRAVVEALGLDGVEIAVERAETLGQAPSHREQYDWAIARAVAAMPVLAEYLLPLVRVGGFALAQKGSGGLSEAQQAARAVASLGGAFEASREILLPAVPDPHLLVVFRKVRPTPSAYPRRPGVPSKNPLV